MPSLRLLGGAVLEDDDGPVTGPPGRPQPLALLALLATAPSRERSRGKLVGILWREASERQARGRLNSCVHRIRSGLGEESVLSVGDSLRLNREVLGCDVLEFEEALREENWERAVELYGGPLLDGFRLKGAPGFEKWVDGERERLARGYREALEALAERAEGQGEPVVAARWWRERVREDPFDSRVVRRLMRSLAASGNRAEALRVARTHERLLEEELNARPDEGVRALAGRIEKGETEDQYGASPRASSSREKEPVHGRRDEAREGEEPAGAVSVAAGTSVSREGDEGAEEQTAVAESLGVKWVLEGAVQRADDAIRVNAQLVDPRTDTHAWAHTYRRDLTAEDLFELQGDLARRIARSLRAELTAREERRLELAPTADLEAYRSLRAGAGAPRPADGLVHAPGRGALPPGARA